MKTLKIYNTLIARIECDYTDFTTGVEEYANELEEMLALDDTNLAEYADSYHGNSYYTKLHEIRISAEWFNGRFYGLAECKVDEDWTDRDTAELKEYLTGQYADGWGEGFEQREVARWTEYEEEYDEFEDESYETETTFYAYISFWQSEGYRIMTEQELKG